MKNTMDLIVPVWIILAVIPLASGLQCYTCTNVNHFNCDGENDAQDCIDGVHNCCQAETVIFDKYRQYSKRCARYEACILIETNWLNNGLCTGEVGSQCLKCCNDTLCNGPDPTDILSSGVRWYTHPRDILPFEILYLLYSVYGMLQ
ncbi:unnamed protein product [Owenia fusiformis]|uniref:Uncharacterized protein n=1 Tax=Owenia fusiformis TaxID=6347 RepID=A0A8S4PCU4_OWEFU|nr:unnamed protein product [Owenia fusiformis]